MLVHEIRGIHSVYIKLLDFLITDLARGLGLNFFSLVQVWLCKKLIEWQSWFILKPNEWIARTVSWLMWHYERLWSCSSIFKSSSILEHFLFFWRKIFVQFELPSIYSPFLFPSEHFLFTFLFVFDGESLLEDRKRSFFVLVTCSLAWNEIVKMFQMEQKLMVPNRTKCLPKRRYSSLKQELLEKQKKVFQFEQKMFAIKNCSKATRKRSFGPKLQMK